TSYITLSVPKSRPQLRLGRYNYCFFHNLFLLFTFCPPLQGLVHFSKSTQCPPFQTFCEQSNQDPAELLTVDEPYTVFSYRLDPKIMLAVEQAGHQQPPQPTKFAVFFRFQDRGLKKHTFAARRLDAYPQLLSLDSLAPQFFDERVPARMLFKIRQ